MTLHSDQMRILTVRQPWAWAIIHGGKDIENRVRNVAGGYRGPVAIHAGLALDESAFGSATLHNAWLSAGGDKAPGGWGISKRGRIIGVVDLVEVHSLHPDSRAPLCSPWAEAGARHLELANPRALAEPIPYRGALGLRKLDAEMTARILAQIGEKP